ncbi:hypothetical protein CLAIMM_13976 isoform 1 [Cladophialophora immunda]|nr:hypothetical protein CLAIMM_13976 isoform 1 [Cladophialophora immunda]
MPWWTLPRSRISSGVTGTGIILVTRRHSHRPLSWSLARVSRRPFSRDTQPNKIRRYGRVITSKFLKYRPAGGIATVCDMLRLLFLRGRELREINFHEPKHVLQIGPFRAFDLFGDGSFYLLDTPGHAIGHLAGLARTTPDTFIMMGGDLCHHGGALRPSEHMPLPREVRLDAFQGFPGGFCPGTAFEKIQQDRGRRADQPFFEPAFGEDITLTMETIGKAQIPDAAANVLFISAHDPSIRGVVDLFPLEANDWKAKGWRAQVYWRFLEDFKDAVQA